MDARTGFGSASVGPFGLRPRRRKDDDLARGAFLFKDFGAHAYALVADIDAGSGDKFFDLRLVLSAEGTNTLALVLGAFARTKSHFDNSLTKAAG